MGRDETPRRSGARDLERYAGLFARRTQTMKSSAMRDLMAITAQPSVISLAGGLPDTSTFPAEDFAALMARVAVDSTAAALQYGPTDGLEDVRRVIVEGMAAEGMRIDVLEQTLARLRSEGRRPKFIYTIPSFQNPAGVTMSEERRRALVKIAHAEELVVLEDNPYGLLRYEGETLPTLHSLDGGRYVIYLGTFSKILSAGLRLGWAAAPRPILEKLNLGKQGSDLCTSSLTQHFVIGFF